MTIKSKPSSPEYRANYDKAFRASEKPKKVVYVAGPMSGYDHLNFKEFFRAQIWLEDQGWEVVNPAEMDVDDLILKDCSKTWEARITKDLRVIETKCDAIYMLAGWEDSRGACREYEKARELGLEIMYQAKNGRLGR